MERGRLYFLGAGNMGEAMLHRIYEAEAKILITVISRNCEKNEYLKKRYPRARIEERLTIPLTEDDILLIATKPKDVKNALFSLPVEKALLVSVAAGISAANLRKITANPRIIRLMPNTPVSVGQGVVGFWAAEAVSKKDIEKLSNVLNPLGTLIFLEEEEGIDLITAVSGSGSAYVFYFMAGLYEAAFRLGFTKEQSHQLTLKTFAGALAVAQESNEEFTALKEKVTSKGGTTFAALSIFKEHHVKETIEKAVTAAKNRAKEMATELEGV